MGQDLPQQSCIFAWKRGLCSAVHSVIQKQICNMPTPKLFVNQIGCEMSNRKDEISGQKVQVFHKWGRASDRELANADFLHVGFILLKVRSETLHML